MDAPDNHQTTILVVDDVSSNALLLKGILAAEGFRVLTAYNGPDAREIADKERPHLILLDYFMPGEDGFEVIQKLQRNATTATIPVLFITGAEDIETKVQAFRLGASDYIVKPFHPEEVKARVRNQLRLSIAMHEMVRSQTAKLRQIQDAQSAMLVQPGDVPEARFGVYYRPIQEAGGDIYDVIAISNNAYGYFVGDVSGHDVGTSFVTAYVKALLRQNCNQLNSPQDSMRIMNSVLNEVLPPGKYLTACYLQLNRKQKMLSLVTMGHPPVLHFEADGKPRLIEMDGDILGAFPDVVFGYQSIKVKPGDRFFVYSDSLVEGQGTARVWAGGTENLLTVAEKVRDLPTEQAPRALFEMMQGGCQVDDDILVLAFEV